MIYMDNAATTRITDSVFQAMLPYLKENYGNPSAIYSLGQRSRAAIENSRIKIAEILGVKASEIYFTSSGSESDNWALKGSLLPNQENHLISSRIEHPAVLNSLTSLLGHDFKLRHFIQELQSHVNKVSGNLRTFLI